MGKRGALRMTVTAVVGLAAQGGQDAQAEAPVLKVEITGSAIRRLESEPRCRCR